MKRLAALAIPSVVVLSSAACSGDGVSADPAATVTVTASPTENATPTKVPTKSITVEGEDPGTTHLVEYYAYSKGGAGTTPDATVRWTTKKLPDFKDFSTEWNRTMALKTDDWASVLVMAKEDVSVGCELYINGVLVDSQGMDADEYKVECESYVP